MKIAIFGATGRTGIPLTRQALEAGHEVVALVRTPAKLPLENERLKVIQGDVLNADDIEKTVQGADAVISVLGPSRQSPKNVLTVAMQHILAAMKKYGVKRLVSLTGAGVDAPQDQPKLINHLFKFALKTMAGDVLKDSIQYTQAVHASGLDWTIVRVPRLADGLHTGKYRIGWVGVNTGTRIAREDVADFLLKQVTDTTYLHQAPMISE